MPSCRRTHGCFFISNPKNASVNRFPIEKPYLPSTWMADDVSTKVGNQMREIAIEQGLLTEEYPCNPALDVVVRDIERMLLGCEQKQRAGLQEKLNASRSDCLLQVEHGLLIDGLMGAIVRCSTPSVFQTELHNGLVPLIKGHQLLSTLQFKESQNAVDGIDRALAALKQNPQATFKRPPVEVVKTPLTRDEHHHGKAKNLFEVIKSKPASSFEHPMLFKVLSEAERSASRKTAAAWARNLRSLSAIVENRPNDARLSEKLVEAIRKIALYKGGLKALVNIRLAFVECRDEMVAADYPEVALALYVLETRQMTQLLSLKDVDKAVARAHSEFLDNVNTAIKAGKNLPMDEMVAEFSSLGMDLRADLESRAESRAKRSDDLLAKSNAYEKELLNKKRQR